MSKETYTREEVQKLVDLAFEMAIGQHYQKPNPNPDGKNTQEIAKCFAVEDARICAKSLAGHHGREIEIIDHGTCRILERVAP